MISARGFVALASVAVVGSAFGQSVGPLDNYYLTAGQSGQNVIIQAAQATLFGQYGGGGTNEYAIAVSGGTVRTAGDGASNPSSGAQYDMGFNATGTTYNSFAWDPNENDLFYDGTSDGAHNYVVSYGYSAEVYSTNLDWTGMTPLFQAVPGFGSNLGITYDSANNSLWVSGWGNTLITDYSMTGTVLSSFSSGMTDMTSLAYDPGDGTLWFGGYLSGTYYQYSTSGTALQTIFYANMAGVNTLGGEFAAPAPEPVSILLVGAGAAALLRRRKK